MVGRRTEIRPRLSATFPMVHNGIEGQSRAFRFHAIASDG